MTRGVRMLAAIAGAFWGGVLFGAAVEAFRPQGSDYWRGQAVDYQLRYARHAARRGGEDE